MAKTLSPRIRWAIPAAVAALAIGAPLAISTAANAEPPLPARTASELLVDLQGLKPVALSGQVKSSADLGLPQLPGAMSPTVSDASLGSLIALGTGTHTWRVWTDGTTSERVDLVQGTSESDVIRHGNDVWLWSSADSSAVHATLPTASKNAPTPPRKPTQGTPAEIADAVLKALDPTTAVTTTRADYVAGRPVYELVFTPKQQGTKVGSVQVALDSETKLPLRVQVFAHDGTDAVDVAFTSITFAKPDASVFAFTPPAGTKVTEAGSDLGKMASGAHPAKPQPSASTDKKPSESVTGTGWTSVMVAKVGAGEASGQLGALLGELPRVSGTWGSGRLLDGSLMSILVTDDGRIAAGAVTPDLLYAALKK